MLLVVGEKQFEIANLCIKLAAGLVATVEIKLNKASRSMGSGPFYVCKSGRDNSPVLNELMPVGVNREYDVWTFVPQLKLENSRQISRVLQVTQQQGVVKEGMGAFVSRWLAPLECVELGNTFGDSESIQKEALPIYCVLLETPGASNLSRLNLLQTLIAERSSDYAGMFSLPMVDESTSGGKWGWYGHINSDDPTAQRVNVCTIVPDEWWFSSDGDIQVSEHLFRDVVWFKRPLGNDPLELIAGIGGSSLTIGDDEDQIPLRPATLGWGGATGLKKFCHTVKFEFNFDRHVKKGENTFINIGVSESRPYPVPIQTSPRTVLARFKEWVGDDPNLIRVEPPLEEDEVPAYFPLWQMAEGNDDGLIAGMNTPGFSREAFSAFYAEMVEGDWVILYLNNGDMPLVLGSLQQNRELSGLSLSDKFVSLRTVDVDGTDAQTSVNLNSEGTVKIDAKSVLSALDVLDVKPDELAVSVDTAIVGKLNVT